MTGVNFKTMIHGYWKVDFETPYCSVCGVDPESFFHTEGYDCVCMNSGKDAPKYCPNCGARMDKVKEIYKNEDAETISE